MGGSRGSDAAVGDAAASTESGRPARAAGRQSRRAYGTGVTPLDAVAEPILRECIAMVRYALSSGLAVPAPVLETVQLMLQSVPRPDCDERAGRAAVMDAAADSWAPARCPPDLAQLGRAHSQLVHIVAPACPRTIMLLYERADTTGHFGLLGGVRLVRQMLVIVVLFTAAFIGLAATKEVNGTGGDIFNSYGRELLINELFFLSAAGIGAGFAALFKVHRYISEGTYDPKFETSYWLRFILGVLAGLLLAELIPAGAGGTQSQLSRPLMALVGGFSSDIVYSVLQFLVQRAEALVKGDGRDLRTAQEQTASVRASERMAQERLEVLGALVGLQGVVSTAESADQIRDELAQIIGALLPGERTVQPQAMGSALPRVQRSPETSSAAVAPAPVSVGRAAVQIPGGAPAG